MVNIPAILPPIGGGGFVTGVITQQTSGDIYCRTDVGGAYRWDASNRKWVQLMDWVPETQKGFSGVEAMAIDPQNANNIYLLCGMDYFDSGKTAILKSTDKGNSFKIVDVTSKFKAHGNGMGRSEWKANRWYFYQLKVGESSTTRKMILIK